jgi:hypothetical protein
VSHMSELHPELYDGVLACGAALLTIGDPPEEPLPWIFKPKIPLLFVSNFCDGVAKLTEFADKCVIFFWAGIPPLIPSSPPIRSI